MIVRKRAKIRNRYNQAPHLTQDINGKVTTSQLDITNDALFIRARVEGKLVELSFRKSVIMAVWSELLGAVVINGPVADPEVVQRFRLYPLPPPVFKYPMKIKQFGRNANAQIALYTYTDESETFV